MSPDMGCIYQIKPLWALGFNSAPPEHSSCCLLIVFAASSVNFLSFFLPYNKSSFLWLFFMLNQTVLRDVYATFASLQDLLPRGIPPRRDAAEGLVFPHELCCICILFTTLPVTDWKDICCLQRLLHHFKTPWLYSSVLVTCLTNFFLLSLDVLGRVILYTCHISSLSLKMELELWLENVIFISRLWLFNSLF